KAPAHLPHGLRLLPFTNILGSRIVAVYFTHRFRRQYEFASDRRLVHRYALHRSRSSATCSCHCCARARAAVTYLCSKTPIFTTDSLAWSHERKDVLYSIPRSALRPSNEMNNGIAVSVVAVEALKLRALLSPSCREDCQDAGIAVEVIPRDLATGEKANQRCVPEAVPHCLQLSMPRAEVWATASRTTDI